jgi:hypothetical protein
MVGACVRAVSFAEFSHSSAFSKPSYKCVCAKNEICNLPMLSPTAKLLDLPVMGDL